MICITNRIDRSAILNVESGFDQHCLFLCGTDEREERPIDRSDYEFHLADFSVCEHQKYMLHQDDNASRNLHNQEHQQCPEQSNYRARATHIHQTD